jgi:FkbM family methyltransferase
MINWFPILLREKALLFDKIISKISSILFNFVIVSVDGNRYQPFDLESLYILSPDFEPWMNNYLSKFEGVVIDVGAHIGKYTIWLAKKTKGKVVALEPNPLVYKVLLKNIKLNNLKNVIALNVGAWSSEKSFMLNVSRFAGHSSIFKNHIENEIIHVREIKVKTIDDIIDNYNIRKVDFIKIDVEGSEIEVLNGMMRVLKEHKPKLVVEVMKWNTEQFKKILNDLEYSLELVPESGNYYVCIPSMSKNHY